MKRKTFKIAQIIISLGKGGAERSCALLSQMLESQGHEVHTVILTDEIDYQYAGELFNLGKFKAEKDSLLKRLRRFQTLRTFLKENKFDVLIDHRPKNNIRRELFYDRLVYRGIPRIYVVHSSLQENYFTSQLERMVKIYNKNLANVAVSKFIKTNMGNLGVRNTVIIHNTAAPVLHESGDDLPEELKGKRFLLWYGRIEDEVKDLTFLLRSFNLSEVWKKNNYLVIMGAGKDVMKIKEQVALLSCSEQVIFLPFTKTPFPIIAAARATLLTSKYEGFPMVLVESLSVGTPVISLNIVSGPAEVIQHKKNGLLIEGRDPKKFAEAMTKICFDDDLYQTCKKNAKKSIAHFSMEIIGEKWNLLLLENIGNHRKAVR